MITIIAKIILFGGLIGMAVIAVRKIPVLKLLTAESLSIEQTASVERKSFLPEAFAIAKEIIKIIWLFLKNSAKEIFHYFKNLIGKKISFKEAEKPNLSDDYWEKIKSGK